MSKSTGEKIDELEQLVRNFFYGQNKKFENIQVNQSIASEKQQRITKNLMIITILNTTLSIIAVIMLFMSTKQNFGPNQIDLQSGQHHNPTISVANNPNKQPISAKTD